MRSKAVLLALAATAAVSATGVSAQTTGQTRVPCDPQNAGLTLPTGFCAVVVADSAGSLRHLVVRPNGDIFAARRSGGVLALRDTTGDGVADVRAEFGDNRGTGIAIRGEDLYVALNDVIVRYRVPQGALRPVSGPDTVVRDLPANRSHTPKSIALGEGNQLFVNIGAPSNSCQDRDRQPGVPGLNPCPELETRAGIWVFDASKPGQTMADGRRWATGIRNAVGITYEPGRGLYAAQHGRDGLFQQWGNLFNEKQSAEKPAEIVMHVREGDDYGWPYCFYDPETRKHVLAPEYGGNGVRQDRCVNIKQPLAAFPGHWGPNAIAVYNGTQFPEPYRGGLFIAFHGSWNRAPLPQGGYNVAFLPMRNGAASGEGQVFADGFAGEYPLMQPRDAKYRPSGLAVGPDGSLYISDDHGGRLWRVFWRGSR